jgi:hypothetical protein
MITDSQPSQVAGAVWIEFSPKKRASVKWKTQRLPEQQLPAELVFAVDLYHRGAPLLSRVVETSASSSWFLT